MNQVTFSINGHTYQARREAVMAFIRTLRKSFRGQNRIIALERGDVIEMRNDEYPSARACTKAVKDWTRRGYHVHYNRKLG